MKLHATRPVGLMSVTAYDNDHIAVEGRRLEQSFLLLPGRLIEGWVPRSFEALNRDAIETIAELGCPIVLLGTGLRQRFPPPEILQPLIARRIGVEVMDNFAACRTYNILIAEERQVVLAAILGDRS